MRGGCSTALAVSVSQPCPPRMPFLRLCHCIAVCQTSSFVSEACVGASAPNALSAFAIPEWEPICRRPGWVAPLEVFDHATQLWLKAFMSSAITLIRSRGCSRISVGVRASNCQLRSRILSRVRWVRR